jgi:hypothetical protein
MPLTDALIRERYGKLIETALDHFGSDPVYVVDMAQAGSLVAYRREESKLRRQLTEAGVPPEQMAERLAEELAARGLIRPKSRSTRTRRKS